MDLLTGMLRTEHAFRLESAQRARETQNLELQAVRAEKDAYVRSRPCRGILINYIPRIASDLLSFQSAINTRDRDLASTRIEVKALTESKAELRAL